MLYLICILFGLGTVVFGQEFCPSCDEVECITTMEQSSCARQTPNFGSNLGLCGCCPGCGAGLGLDVYGCNVAACATGLICTDFVCRINRAKCNHLNYLKTLYRWVPSCNMDDTYKAVQCKGDRASGRCFCYSETGTRIFGWDWALNHEDMHCTCSQKRNKQEAAGKLSTLHCTHNGGFEELQCEEGICWCAEEKTGDLQVGTVAVPKDMWKLLPCYNATQMGTSYLRQCESVAYAQELLQRKFALHGAASISMRAVLCDYDGSYGSYSISSGIASCQWRDGSRLGSYAVQANQASLMNCNCARDIKIYEEQGSSLSILCGGNGNYESLQEVNQMYFCIDNDGFDQSGLLPLSPIPDCDTYFHYKYIKKAGS